VVEVIPLVTVISLKYKIQIKLKNQGLFDVSNYIIKKLVKENEHSLKKLAHIGEALITQKVMGNTEGIRTTLCVERTPIDLNQ
jgi:hypothetical protein